MRGSPVRRQGCEPDPPPPRTQGRAFEFTRAISSAVRKRLSAKPSLSRQASAGRSVAHSPPALPRTRQRATWRAHAPPPLRPGEGRGLGPSCATPHETPACAGAQGRMICFRASCALLLPREKVRCPQPRLPRNPATRSAASRRRSPMAATSVPVRSWVKPTSASTKATPPSGLKTGAVTEESG